MRLSRSIERQYMQYMNRLQAEMKVIPEYVDGAMGSALPKPSDTTFENARRVIHLLCELYGEHSHVASRFCVTIEGKFQVQLTENSSKGTVTVDETGMRLYNWYRKTNKYVNLSMADDKIIAQFKKYMKDYL